MMASVASKNTKPEKIVRSLLHKHGYRFRIHKKDLQGKPDIVLPKYRTVIFVHGCFWHQHKGCPKSARPRTRTEFWDKKLDENIKRDCNNLASLEKAGWTVRIVWECQTKNVGVLAAILLPISNKISS